MCFELEGERRTLTYLKWYVPRTYLPQLSLANPLRRARNMAHPWCLLLAIIAACFLQVANSLDQFQVDLGYVTYRGSVNARTGNTEFLGMRYAQAPTSMLDSIRQRISRLTSRPRIIALERASSTHAHSWDPSSEFSGSPLSQRSYGCSAGQYLWTHCFQSSSSDPAGLGNGVLYKAAATARLFRRLPLSEVTLR